MFNTILRTNAFETIILEKAKGSWIWDIEGRRYLDCESGMWCCNLGHNHVKIIDALKNQSDKIIHRNKGFLTSTTLKASQKVLDFVSSSYDKITFLNSGSEAMEFGISFSKKVTKRQLILTLQNSYFGAFGDAKKTSYTSIKSQEMKLMYPICFSDNCNCLDRVKSSLDEILNAIVDDVACFVFEPIMVSGGVLKPCSKFIEYICDRIQTAGGLIVVDEVTTGFGRTGKKFGFEHYNIDPDIIVLGKALGNGYPISAVITKSELEKKCILSDLYYVQSHQLDPLGAAVALSTVDVFKEERILEKSIETSRELSNFFHSLSFNFIEEIRAIGMIFAIQIKDSKEQISEELVLKIKDQLLKESISVGYNTSEGLIRLLPPLNMKKQEVTFLKNKIKKTLTKIE